MPYTIFHWKYYALYMFCQLCALPHIWKPCLLTDFLLSVSSRAANYAPHKTIMLHGELSATSPAHHRMAINHLLHRLIYNALLRTRCHTQTESMITTQRVVDALICLILYKGFPCTWFFKVWAGRSRTYEELIFPACPKQVMELKNLLHCQYADDIQSDDKCGKHRNRKYGAKEVFFYRLLLGRTENL